MKKEFKKSDLKTGDQIEKSNGKRFVIMLGTQGGDCYVEIGGMVWGNMDGFDENLKDTGGYHEFDVSKVYRSGYQHKYTSKEFDEHELIWKREEEPQEMTLEEVCKELGREIKIVKNK